MELKVFPFGEGITISSYAPNRNQLALRPYNPLPKYQSFGGSMGKQIRKRPYPARVT